MPRIAAVHALPKAQAVVLQWDDGTESVKDMSALIATRRVFAPLADRALFERVSVVDDGRAIQWTDDIDYCADALWMETVEIPRDPSLAAE